MAQQALVDTGVIYSAFHRRDEHHETGLRIVKDADSGRLPQLVVLDFVLAETMNALTHLLVPAQATEALSMLKASDGFDIVRINTAVWSAGQEIFTRIDPLSFVDSLLVAFARERDLPFLYAFDTGFDRIEGIQRLNTNLDPYEP